MTPPTIQQAKANVEVAQGILYSVVKERLADALLATFADPSFTNVVFGVSTCPYNDGALHEGFFGPFANFELEHEDDFSHDDQWRLLDYYTKGDSAPLVSHVLNEAEWENVAAALGLGERSAVAMVATRTEDGNFNLHQYDIESDY